MTKFAIFPAFAMVATPALAQPMVVADSGDSAWVLAATMLALAILPGLVLLRERASDRPLALPVALVGAIALLVFALVGYSLAFGEGSTWLGGAGNLLLANLADLRGGTTIPESLYALFETVVAAVALATLGAAVAGRARLAWFVPFAAIWLLIVYVPVARWMWGGGWLAELGALDYAGGIVVQIVAGVAALVVGLLLRGRDDTAAVGRMPLGGAALLTFGWLGIIGGSALGGGDDAASALIDALLAVGAGLLTAWAIAARRSPDVAASCATGIVAALAAIATSAGFVGPLGAIVLGGVAAALALLLARFVDRLHIGEAGSAFVAHGVGGIVGALAFPAFVLTALGGPGLEDGANVLTQFAAQAIAVLAIILWSAVGTAIAALAVSMIAPMRSAGTNAE